MTTHHFTELTDRDLRGIHGGDDSAATQIASRDRRIAEDRVTTSCKERFAPNADKALACITGAGEEAFQRTMKQFSGAPASR